MTGNTPAALAAKNATQTIPIVMMAIDPVGLGLVGSLSRLGGNVTGLSYYNEAVTGKRLARAVALRQAHCDVQRVS